MRLMAGILVILAALWSGYWFIGQRAVERGFEAWLSDAPARGLDIEYSNLDTTGFPNRFDTKIRDISVRHIASETIWRAPFLQVFALSYRPHRAIAVWPNEQTLAVGAMSLKLLSSDMRGSMSVESGAGRALEQGRLVAENLRIQQESREEQPTGTFGIARLLVATRQAAGRSDAHDLAVELSGLSPAPGIKVLLDPLDELPRRIDGLSLDATLRFDGPVGLADALPPLTGLSINGARLRWGDLLISARGELSADAQGIAEGKLKVEVGNWRQMFTILGAVGVADPVWEGVIQLFAESDGSPLDLSIPLDFSEGMVRLGPFPLGPAPRLN